MISEDEFWNVFGVITPRDGGLREVESVKRHPLNRVWTIVESGDDLDGNWYAIPGYHYVNRLGYVLTKKPWEDETLDAVYFLDDMERGEDDRSLPNGDTPTQS